MREKLEMLLDELQYLKGEGVSFVYCEEETLDRLKVIVKESIGSEKKIEERASDSRISTAEFQDSVPLKKLNPFSPLPSGTTIIESKTTIEKVIPANLESIERIDLPKASKQVQWDYLRAKIEQAFSIAVLNKEAKAKSKIIFGAGSLDSDVLFCGDSPGIEEEAEGVPIAGGAGQLLTKIIQAMNLSQDRVYLTNIFNWVLEAPAHLDKRAPTQQELNTSLPYLTAQIEIIKPKVIVALGTTAVTALLGVNKSGKLGDIRGQWFNFESTPLMVTFHPSYLIHNNTLRTKRLVWEDMMKVMTCLNIPINEKQRRFFQ